MMKKLTLLSAVGIGYVLGARAGRERYDELQSAFDKFKSNPKVQATAHQAADVAKEKAPVVKEKLSSVAGTATDKVKGSGGPEDALPDESLVHQSDPYPQGDLP